VLPHEGAYLGSKNTRKTKALRSLRKQGVGAFTFSKINSVTYRIDRQGKNGVGWLMEVAWPGGGRERWVACVGTHRCEPLPLEGAEIAAKTLLTAKRKAEPREWIKQLNQLAANEVDQAYWPKEKRKWPLDLMAGQRHCSKKPLLTLDHKLRQAILETERVLKDQQPISPAISDDVQLEYYPDGFPKLPAWLDRRLA
jgi:hypothetical protein